MNEQSQETYRKLIEALLKCGSRQEINEILNANQDLIDAGLVQTMTKVAKVLEEDGDKNAADFLINIASQLSEYLGLTSSTLTSSSPQNSESQLTFLKEVLSATFDSNGELQAVYPLMQSNIDKLNDNFATVLQSWAMKVLLEVDPEKAQVIASVIGEFSNLIQQFPLGNIASNLEIAIHGYEIATTVFTYELFPHILAAIQNNIGTAYRSRIRGDKAENLEMAIRYYQAALQVRTRKAFPQDWARTQNNLALAYRDRIRGDKAENLEMAIRYYQASLQVRTREAFPQDWAATQNNLGTAYSHRIRGDKAENLEMAIRYYQASLQVRTREAFPQDWAATQNNLALTYLCRIDLLQKSFVVN
ncbi:tetratricopeptide repeat protein [Nostocales cyanobacterium LEGE 12452]|nr:tetratricopeptide repeat protein [Nostocales cyanobacterium LEGE 12452]